MLNPFKEITLFFLSFCLFIFFFFYQYRWVKNIQNTHVSSSFSLIPLEKKKSLHFSTYALHKAGSRLFFKLSFFFFSIFNPFRFQTRVKSSSRTDAKNQHWASQKYHAQVQILEELMWTTGTEIQQTENTWTSIHSEYDQHG